MSDSNSDHPPPSPEKTSKAATDNKKGKDTDSVKEYDDPRILVIEEDADDEGPELPPESEFIAAPSLKDLTEEDLEEPKKRKISRGKSKQRLRTPSGSICESSTPVAVSPEKKHHKKVDSSGGQEPSSDVRHHHHHHKQKASDDQTAGRKSKKSVRIQPPPGEGAGSGNQSGSEQPVEQGSGATSGKESNSGDSQSSSSSSSEDEWSSDSSSNVDVASRPKMSRNKFGTLNLGELSSAQEKARVTPAQRHSSMKNIRDTPLSHSSPAGHTRDGSASARISRPSFSPVSSFHIRSRTFSEIDEGPLQKVVLNLPIGEFVKNCKLARVNISDELLAERTPRAAFQASHQRICPQRKLARQAILATQAAHAQPGAQNNAANAQPPPSLPSIGVIVSMTNEQLEQYGAQVEEFQKQKAGMKKQFGGTVEEQAAQPGHDSNPNVPPFFLSLMAKLRSYGPKADERSLLMMWELEKEPPSDVMVEKDQLESGRLRLEQMVIEPRHLIYLLLEYFKCLSSPLIGYEAQSLLLPVGMAEYDDLELAASILPGLWALRMCEYETVKNLVLTLRELYITPSRKAMSAAFQIASVIANPMFQASPKDEKLKRAYVQLVSCMLFNGGDLFEAPPQMAFRPTPTGDMLLQAAAPPFLLETLSNEFYEETSFSYIFLLSYQYYMTHEELYGVLASQCRKIFESKERAVWRDRKRALILGVIGRWVRVRGSELLVDAPEVVDLLKNHFGDAPATDKLNVRDFLQESTSHIPTVVFFSEHGSEASSLLLLTQMDSSLRTLAEQISLFHQKLFSFIPISELIKKKKIDPEVSDSDIFTASFVTSFNKLTKWLISKIVSSDEKKTVELLSSSIKLAKELLKLNNFNGAMAVSAALQHPAVERIQTAWERVPKKLLGQMKELTEIFNLNFSNYRPLISNCSPPGVPCLIVIQHDLFGLEENAKTWLPEKGAPNSLINFDKLRMIGAMLQQVKLFQLTPYDFKPIAGIQEALKNLPVLDDSAVYSRRKLSASAPARSQ